MIFYLKIIIECSECGRSKYIRYFPFRRKNYTYNKEKICKKCKNNIQLKKNTLKHVLQRCLTTSKTSTKERLKKGRKECGINTLTINQLIKMFEEQNGKCKLSNVKLSLNTNSNNIVSIDRIDSNKGYTIDNIQLVSKIVNQAKNNLSMEDFKSMVFSIYENFNKKNLDNIIISSNKFIINDLKIDIKYKDNIIKNLEEQVLSLKDRLKNIKKELKKLKNKKLCIDCGKEIFRTSERCNYCNNKYNFINNTKKCKRPSYEQLIKDKNELKTFVAIGRKYCVSDSAVIKWFKTYSKYKTT